MRFRVNLNKLLLATLGAWLPCRRHPFGRIANALRIHFARQICAKVGKNVLIERGASFNEDVVLEDNASVGVNCFLDFAVVVKGPNLMGPGVKIFTRSHLYREDLHTFEGYAERKPVVIEPHTWIGTRALIMPGITIGAHSIVGGGSVVTKNVPAGVLVAGNPAVFRKVIDKNFFKE